MKTVLLILGLLALPAMVGYYFTSKKGNAYSRPSSTSSSNYHTSPQGGSGNAPRR